MKLGYLGFGAQINGVTQNLMTQAKRAGVALQPYALYDTDPKRFDDSKSFFGFEVNHDSVEALVSDPDVDWVLIGSPNGFHMQHAVAALEAGKPVFCEKPLATTLDDCLRIRDAWRRAGVPFVIGFSLRYHAMYRKVKALLDAGVIGDIVSMEFNETLEFNHGGFIHQNWRRRTELAGTHLLEKCCHDMDLANWYVGSRARRVASFGGCDFFNPENRKHAERIGPNPDTGLPAYQGWGSPESPFRADKDIVDNQVAILEFDNCVRATFHTNCNAAIPERRMLLVGAEGAIRADVITGRLEYQRIGWDQPRQVYPNLNGEGGHAGADPILARELLAAMTDGAPMSAGVDEGLASAVTCFAIDEAMRCGGVVDVSPYWHRVDEPDNVPMTAQQPGLPTTGPGGIRPA